MYLTPNPKNRPDSTVREVQAMLNALRNNYHHSWEYLTVDGIYGNNTASAVKKFQEYRGISSQMTPSGPVLGDTTIVYIKDEYKTVPQLKAASGYMKPYKEPYRNTINIGEEFMGFIATFDSFLNAQIDHIKSLRLDNPQSLKAKYYSIATQLDPRLKNLKLNLQKAFNSKGKPRQQFNDLARSNRKRIISDLKKFNIVEKIEKILAEKGISGKIELKTFRGKPAVLQVRGSGILQCFVYKDVIVDLCDFRNYGTEQWKEDLHRDFAKLIDALIVGVVSQFAAELVAAAIAAGAAAVGVTVSAGVIVIIVAIVALLIGLIIGYLMYQHDFSFGELALEGYTEIVGAIKIW